MKLVKKLIIFSVLLAIATSQSGCVEKVLFPEGHYTVTVVTPDKLRATITEEEGEDGEKVKKAKLPGTVVSLNSDYNIPADLVSFSISYTTRLGESIPSVEVPETPYSIKVPAGASVEIPMNPYTSRLYDLLEFTRSDVSPVNAKMIFTIKDVNGNKVKVDANCLCYATWDEIAE